MNKVLGLSACALMLLVGTSDYAFAGRSSFGPRDPQALTVDGSTAIWMHGMSVWTHEVGGQFQVPRERAEFFCGAWGRNQVVRQMEATASAAMAMQYNATYGTLALFAALPQPDDADKRINKNCAALEKSSTDMVTLFD